jgi:hypothetical protein
MSTRRLVAAFAAAAAVYLIVALITIGSTAHPLRPLYEGIGPAPPYRWVRPPAAFRSTNVVPQVITETIPLGPSGSVQSGMATIDGQFVLSLPAGAIPASTSDHAVLLTITPLDPAKLSPPPPGLFSDGNAYRVTASYQPSEAPVSDAVKPIDAVIRTPVPSVALLMSVDGKTWTRLADNHIPGQAAVATTFTQFGYFLPVTNARVVSVSSTRGSSLWLIVILGLVAAVLVGFSLLWRTRHRRKD